MRETFIFTLLSLFIQFTGLCQVFQSNIKFTDKHFQDVNTVQLEDGSQDYIIGGTVFNADFSTAGIFLARVSSIDGNVIWQKEYDSPTGDLRGFDITRFQENGNEFIAITGSVENGLHRVFIATFNVSSGIVVNNEVYDLDPTLNSQGLKIIYSEQNFNGAAHPSLVVAGYMNGLYNTDIANNSKGFILRVETTLGLLWVSETNSTTTAPIDYDAVNSVTEILDGFFITGSVNQPSGSQQGILLAGLDGEGQSLWDNSYIEGNHRDVGADTYYDNSTDTLYLLTNYSEYHYFGITTLNASSGVIDFAKSWYWLNTSDFNKTGFSITKSLQSSFPNDLVIHGYERDKNIYDNSGSQVTANTLPFALSFDRDTGNINRIYTYIVPYSNPVLYNDYFRFWDGQMPRFYFPDIAVPSTNHYFTVGYRTYSQETTGIEMLSTPTNLLNECENEIFSISKFSLNTTAVPVAIQLSNTNQFTQTFTIQNIGLELYTCEDGGVLSISESSKEFFEIYPNPASDVIKVSVNETQIISYSILDMQGRVITSERFLETSEISITHLKNGMYFLQLNNSEKNTITQKFIKN